MRLEKRPFISFVSHEIRAAWEDTIQSTERQLLETLLYGIHEKLTIFEIDFWREIAKFSSEIDSEILESWFVKLYCFLEQEEKKIMRRKCKKLSKFISDPVEKKMALDPSLNQILDFGAMILMDGVVDNVL